jgi:Ig-like domain-containing protein
MVKRIAGISIIALLASLGVSVSPAHAATCGTTWWPGRGTIETTYVNGSTLEDDHLDLTTRFIFSKTELDALRCTGDAALEVDLLIYSGTRDKNDLKTWDSNLPRSYLDTEAQDADIPRTLSVGTLDLHKLVAGVQYYTHIRLIRPRVTEPRADIKLNFQRGHWARNLLEKALCAYHGYDPAWCVFASGTQPMASLGGKVTFPFTQNAVTAAATSWGGGVSSPPGHDCEAFVADVTVPDGTTVTAGTTFIKTWRLKNCGTTDWSGLTAVRISGAFGPDTFGIPKVSPGATADISATMTAPGIAGHYRSTYRLRAADGHYADNSFWVDINVVSPAPTDRFAITSYDRMAPGAPYHGYFTSAWQGFVARSNRLTYLGVTVGNPTLPAGQPVSANVLVRLCTSPSCSVILAQASPQIVNYGNSAVDIGNVPVTPGAIYYIVWYQPPAAGGTTWVTYWWSGGPGITQSDQMQAVVKGFNA